MNKYLLSIFTLFCHIVLLSQKDNTDNWPKEEKNLFESANALYEEKIYNIAYERFTDLLKKHPNDLYLKYLTGICGIYNSDKYDEALSYLNEVYSKNKKAADIDYYLAHLYHRTQQFDKSIEIANKLLKDPKLNSSQNFELQQLINYCNNGKTFTENPLSVNIQNIGNPPNSEASEYSPVITSDEEILYFTYRGKESNGGLRDIFDKPNPYGFYYEDIFMSKKIDGKWQTPVSIGENNTESNDAVIAISNDGQQLFIFRSSTTDGGDIYVSRLNGNKFEAAEKLRGEINTPYWEGSISLSSDQKKIIFASERPGGFGSKDIYQAVKLADDTWGNVKNLGEKINTPLDDDAPFLHPDGRTLIFSSKGHNSMGEYDIFLSDLDEVDSTWKEPVNIGYPINTTGDDIYYVLSADGKHGYYASARKGGYGEKDIYLIEPAVSSKKSYLTIIKGKVTENSIPAGVDITVVIANDGRNFGTFKSNMASGNYLVNLPSGYNYKLSFY
ncbi:MAG TPA: tetratricopeptide repeat protein, partial [Bacteroidia bacterium]|nr:tetratricopeptide repeat protein [Bacteroidia bacterium]